MHRCWFAYNPASGSTSEDKGRALLSVLDAAGCEIVGGSTFPADPMPTADALDAAGADTMIVFAGDGTINAAAMALEDWSGKLLALPGGTMNILPVRLHGRRASEAILDDALAGAPAVPLPSVAVGPHRAFVSLIAGPVAAWTYTREVVRARRIDRLRRALRFAWHRSLRQGLSLGGYAQGSFQAVVISPTDSALSIAAARVQSLGDAARISLDMVAGDWRASPAVVHLEQTAIALFSRRPVDLLFDGELVKLQSPVSVGRSQSKLRFIVTAAAP